MYTKTVTKDVAKALVFYQTKKKTLMMYTIAYNSLNAQNAICRKHHLQRQSPSDFVMMTLCMEWLISCL